MLRKLMRAESTWQLLDQGAVSAGNFLTTLVLARSLSPDLYGTFSLLFISLIAVNTLHASLVIYPLTLNAARADTSRVGSIAGESCLQTFIIAPIQSFVLLITALFTHRLDLFPLLFLSMVAWQLQETARRTLLAHRRPIAAFLPDALSYIGQGLLVFGLHLHSLTAVFTVVASTSLVAGLIQLGLLKANWQTAFRMAHLRVSWDLGRFTLAANLLTMLMIQIPGWALVLSAGRGAVAGYQSLYNLVGVANPIILSVSNLLIPTIARAGLVSRAAARAAMYTYGVRFGILLIPLFAVLLFFPVRCMMLIYGSSSPYIVLAPLLRIFIVAVFFDYVSTVVGAYEGGNGRPRTYMFAQIMSACSMLLVGIALIHQFGIAGAALSMLVMSTTRMLAFAKLSNRYDTKLRQLNMTLN